MKHRRLIEYAGISLIAASVGLISSCNHTKRDMENLLNESYNYPTDIMSTYETMDITRPKLDKTIESWKRLYDSIKLIVLPGGAFVSNDEAKYIDKFMRLSEKEKAKRMDTLKYFDFITGENYFKNITFLYHVEKNKKLAEKAVLEARVQK